MTRTSSSPFLFGPSPEIPARAFEQGREGHAELLKRACAELLARNVAWSPLVDHLMEARLWPDEAEQQSESALAEVWPRETVLDHLATRLRGLPGEEISQALGAFRSWELHRLIAAHSSVLEASQVRLLRTHSLVYEAAAGNRALSLEGAEGLYVGYARNICSGGELKDGATGFPIRARLREQGYRTPIQALEALLETATRPSVERPEIPETAAAYLLSEFTTPLSMLDCLLREFKGEGLQNSKLFLQIFLHPAGEPELWHEAFRRSPTPDELVRSLVRKEGVSAPLLNVAFPFVRRHKNTVLALLQHSAADLPLFRRAARETGYTEIRQYLVKRSDCLADVQVRKDLARSDSPTILEPLLRVPDLEPDEFHSLLGKLATSHPARAVEILETVTPPAGIRLQPVDLLPLLQAREGAVRERAMGLWGRLGGQGELAPAGYLPGSSSTVRPSRQGRAGGR